MPPVWSIIVTTIGFPDSKPNLVTLYNHYLTKIGHSIFFRKIYRPLAPAKNGSTAEICENGVNLEAHNYLHQNHKVAKLVELGHLVYFIKNI